MSFAPTSRQPRGKGPRTKKKAARLRKRVAAERAGLIWMPVKRKAPADDNE